MADRSALLQAVSANPDDTLVRLVYADFLDETGQSADAKRAELEKHLPGKVVFV